MLSTIVILFLICWLPIQALNLMVWFKRDWLESIYATDVGYWCYVTATIVAHWLSMANSFVNPIIYCFMSENFRVSRAGYLPFFRTVKLFGNEALFWRGDRNNALRLNNLMKQIPK